MSDSEESDGEGGLGNVNRLVVRPPGHSGKAKRGHLCFDAAFECGNLGRADHVNELEYDLFLRPDTCRPRSRFWYNFTVENVRQDQRVIFNIVNLGKDRNLYATDMTPLVRSTSRPKWQRMPRRMVFYQRSAAHGGRHVLSLSFCFDREEDVYYFTAAVPYSYSRLQKYLSLWEKKTSDFAKRELLATTTQKRRVDLLSIGEQCARPQIGAKCRMVLIIARAHGGEPPSSFVCQGILDYLASSSEKSKALRKGIIVKVIPMLNPDGVFLGRQRSDLLGSDLNRCWDRATSYAHPALVAANFMLSHIANDSALQLDFVIDIHADVSQTGVFVRGNSFEDVYRFERHVVLAKLLGGRIEAWQPEQCLYNSHGGAAGTARRHLAVTPHTDAYSLIVSLGGRRLTPRGPYMHYNEEDYAKIGRGVVRALFDFYSQHGVVEPCVGRRRARQRRRPPAPARRRRQRRSHREKSSDSSPERVVLAGKQVCLGLPEAGAAPSPVGWAPRPAPARRYHARALALDDLPLTAGKMSLCARTPRLAVVDLSASVRAPGQRAPPPAAARCRAAVTSDDYTSQDTDSD